MGLPIIFVHGIGASASQWGKFDIPGHPVFYISFSNRFADPSSQVPELTKFIDNVLQKTNQEKIILVCHSMGGLVARKYLADNRYSHKVDKLILLSAPNRGTVWFSFNLLPISPAAWAMRPNSRFVRDLKAVDMPEDVKYVSVLSDTKVFPYRFFNIFLFREGGDGAIPLSSQKLSAKSVPNFSKINYSEYRIDLPHFAIPRKIDPQLLIDCIGN